MGIFNFLKKLGKKEIKKKEEMSLNKDRVNKQEVSININTSVTEPYIFPIEKRLKNLTPDEYGLFPHEILLLFYAPRYKIGENNFPRFWWYQYGIQNVNDYLYSLMDRGFLAKGSVEETMKKHTVKELKEILRENNLKVSGKKKELVQRLEKEISKEKLASYFNSRVYERTLLGEEALNNALHIPYIHNNKIIDLDIWTFDKLIKNKPQFHYKEVVLEYLEKQAKQELHRKNFGLYGNNRLTLSDFLWKEGEFEKAFDLLLEVIIHDLSGLSNNFDKDFLYITSQSFYPYEKSIVTIPPGILQRLEKYQLELEITDQELYKKLIENRREIELPYSFFTTQEMAEIVIKEKEADTNALKEIYEEAGKRVRKTYKF